MKIQKINTMKLFFLCHFLLILGTSTTQSSMSAQELEAIKKHNSAVSARYQRVTENLVEYAFLDPQNLLPCVRQRAAHVYFMARVTGLPPEVGGCQEVRMRRNAANLVNASDTETYLKDFTPLEATQTRILLKDYQNFKALGGDSSQQFEEEKFEELLLVGLMHLAKHGDTGSEEVRNFVKDQIDEGDIGPLLYGYIYGHLEQVLTF